MLWWGDVAASLLDYSEQTVFSFAAKNDEDFEVALKIALDSMAKMSNEELLSIIMSKTQQ